MDQSAQALEDVYRRRYVGFRNALATVTGSYDTAHDAVQEGFARALKARKTFRGGSLEAWVWKIALRAALEREPRLLLLATVPDSDFVEPERDPELTAAIRSLAPRRRLIVFLRYFADLSYEEIAEACSVSEGTVAATLAQAHEALAGAVGRRNIG